MATFTVTRLDYQPGSPPSGSLVNATSVVTVNVGPRGRAGPNSISDATALGTLTSITDPAYLLVAKSTADLARKLVPTGWGLSNLLATVPAGRVPYSHTDGTVTSSAGFKWYPGAGLELGGYVLSTNFAQTADKGRLNSSGLRLSSDVSFGFTSSTASSGTVDTELTRSSAGFVGLGTPTNKVVVGHDGTNGIIESQAGELVLRHKGAGGMPTAGEIITIVGTNNYGGIGYLPGSSVGGALSYGGFYLGFNGQLMWTSAGPLTASPDTALARNAAGVLEINNGTAGQYRDLRLRTLLLTNGSQIYDDPTYGLYLQPTTGKAEWLGQLTVNNNSTGGDGTKVPVKVRGNGSQTSNLTEWQTNTPTTVASVSAAGLGTFAGLMTVGDYRLSAWGGYIGVLGGERFEVPSTGIIAHGRATVNPVFRVRGVSGQTANLQEWQTNTPTTVASVSAAGLGTFAGVTSTGTLTVQQSGGTPGTDQLELSHDGTRGTLQSKDGGLRLLDSNTAGIHVFRNGGSLVQVEYFGTGVNRIQIGDPATQTASCGFWTSNPGTGAWYPTNPAYPILFQDVAIRRSAAKVLDLYDGSTGGGTISSVPLAVSITADQNDYTPGVAMYIDLTTDGTDRHVTGLLAGVNGQTVYIRHVAGAGNLILDHESASSAAANRFDIEGAANSTVPLRGSVMLTYSTVISRWRAFPSKSCT